MKPELVTKLAISGLTIVSTVMLYRAFRRRMRNIVFLGQAYDEHGHRTPWAGVSLGNSGGANTIGAAGCVETSITMAYNSYNTDAPMTPDVANEIIRNNGGFAAGSADMFIEKGANALGMDMPANMHLSAPRSLSEIIPVMNKVITDGAMALLRVFHGKNPVGGDHTVLLYGGGAGEYYAADPALARSIKFDANLISVDGGAKWGAKVPYRCIGVVALYNS